MTDSAIPQRRKPPVPLRLSDNALARAERIQSHRGDGTRRHAVLVEAVDLGLDVLESNMVPIPSGTAVVNGERYAAVANGKVASRRLERDARPNFKGGKK